MRDESQRLLQAIRVGHIGIFEHDHDTDTIYWSPELREMYGWDADEPVTLQKIMGAAHHEDAERIISSIRAAHDTAGNGLFDIEHRAIHRQGSVRWLITRSQTLFETSSRGRRPLRTIGAVQDVTEHRLAEERLRVLEAQLVHAKKMESIGRLAGGIAHDFNNLLTVISGSIGLTLAELPTDTPYRDCLEDAAQAAGSAAGLTRQLLAFARKEVIAPQVLDLGELMRRVRRMINWLVGDEISVETRLAPDLESVRFDPAQLEQVILNLAVNARDAMATGGRLTIEASNLFLPKAHSPGRLEVELAAGHYVLLSVSDTGHGMTDETRAHVFEPFFTTKEAGKGTGLGLSTVYGAVQQNGGAMELESAPGHGSTFKIYLPAALETRAPCSGSNRPSPSARTRQASILLVDDYAQVASFTKTVLENLGHTVHVFSSGADALAALPALRPVPELLISDVVMPKWTAQPWPTLSKRSFQRCACCSLPAMRSTSSTSVGFYPAPSSYWPSLIRPKSSRLALPSCSLEISRSTLHRTNALGSSCQPCAAHFPS